MKRFALALLLSASVVFGQYKMEPAGAPPSDLPTAFTAMLQPQGFKILGPSGSVYCEVWLRTQAPSGPKVTDDAITLPTFPQGALLGVIRFAGPAQDRRGQPLKAGTYTLRYSQYPVNGDHQGVAPQRDFALLVRAEDDKDASSTPGFDALVALSAKASGTPHPAVLSIWGSSADKYPNLSKQGDHDWVLDAKLGSIGISFILAGKAEG
ncbi:MAG TPA: hypothetical protein VKR61_15830 [Bryobacteraceae bacterium]|nr:hypothetical protein [Bryobacteraceae bacterium]